MFKRSVRIILFGQINGSRNSHVEERKETYCLEEAIDCREETTNDPSKNGPAIDVEMSQQNVCPIIIVSEAEPENIITTML